MCPSCEYGQRQNNGLWWVKEWRTFVSTTAQMINFINYTIKGREKRNVILRESCDNLFPEIKPQKLNENDNIYFSNKMFTINISLLRIYNDID